MALLDIVIVVIYLSVMIFIGFYFQKKASQSIESYFLGDKKLSWWVLGASGMSSNFDISGTMINVAFIYALGVSGFFIELRGGIVLIMAFLMIFMGKWNRRAGVMTMAEWMQLRFGDGFQGKIARLISALANLLSSVAIVTYFAFGAGKFIGEFLGIPDFGGFPSNFWAATLMIALAMIYTVASGLYGVVWTDVFQGIFIFITIITVSLIAFFQFDLPDKFNISIPLLNGDFTSIATSKQEWTKILPSWHLGLPENSSYSIYNLMGISVLFYFMKTSIEGFAGTGGYMIQRFYASKSDKEAGKLSLLWISLLSFRWPFVISIALMGIVLGNSGALQITDPEAVLPVVINNMLPVGLKGLMIAGLMAAAMSTFDSVVNAGAAYWVKDIYQAFIKKEADEKSLIRQSRYSSVAIVIIGLFLTLNLTSINDIWGWLTMSIGAGLIIPMIIRWYWWRLNGLGFAIGTSFGMIAALLQSFLFPGIPEYISFLSVSFISLTGTIAGTLLTEKTNESTMIEFYKRTKPFGFWKPVREKIGSPELNSIRKENKRDLISLMFAIPWQLMMFLLLMMIIIKDWSGFLQLGLIFSVVSVFLYRIWYRNLND